MRNFFEQYSQVLVIIIVAIALIAIAMGLKTIVGNSLTDMANDFTNKAQEVIDDGFKVQTHNIRIANNWVLYDIPEGMTWREYIELGDKQVWCEMEWDDVLKSAVEGEKHTSQLIRSASYGSNYGANVDSGWYTNGCDVVYRYGKSGITPWYTVSIDDVIESSPDLYGEFHYW